MKSVIVKLAILGLIVSQTANAQVRAGVRDSVRDSQKHGVAKDPAQKANEDKVSLEVKKLQTNFNISNERGLTDVLIRNEIIEKIVREDKGGKVEVTSTKVSMQQMANQLMTVKLGTHTAEQVQLAEAAFNLFGEMKVRTVEKSPSLNKLIVEAVDIAITKDKATKEQVLAFSTKLIAIKQAVEGGKAITVDEAAEKVLTEKQKKDLRDCVSA